MSRKDEEWAGMVFHACLTHAGLYNEYLISKRVQEAKDGFTK